MLSTKHTIFTAHAPAPIGPYSQAVMAGNMLFVSGQIAMNPETNEMITDDIKEEAQQVMLNIGTILKAADLHYHNIVKTSIFLKDMNNFAAVNEVYSHFFSSEFPARETVEVSRLPKDVNVEISVIAIKD